MCYPLHYRAPFSLKFGKTFSFHNKVSVYMMYFYIYWLLYQHSAEADSGELKLHDMQEGYEYSTFC